MNLDMNIDELRVVVSALKDKCNTQFTKLTNPHLDQKYVDTYKQVHQDAVSLHTKLHKVLLSHTPDFQETPTTGELSDL